MASYDSKAGDSAGAGGGGGSSASSSDLRANESVFLLNGKTPVIALSDDGSYRYLGFIPNWTTMQADKQSREYKQAIRDYNIKLQTHSDGTVTVEKGGLYSRKRTFKSKSAFIKDAEKRLRDSSILDDSRLSDIIHGIIPQIQAENFRSITRSMSSSMAAKEMKKQIRETMQAAVDRYSAYQTAKTKLQNLFN
jgi:hypothetical protein